MKDHEFWVWEVLNDLVGFGELRSPPRLNPPVSGATRSGRNQNSSQGWHMSNYHFMTLQWFFFNSIQGKFYWNIYYKVNCFARKVGTLIEERKFEHLHPMRIELLGLLRAQTPPIFRIWQRALIFDAAALLGIFVSLKIHDFTLVQNQGFFVEKWLFIVL